MSFRTKIIILILLVSLVPYTVIMIYAGKTLREEYYNNTQQEMTTQLSLSVNRIEQYLENLRRDMVFITHLDIMNDIYSKDVDRRISNLLTEKRQDLNLEGDFSLVDTSGLIIASSNPNKIFTKTKVVPFFSITITSSFDQSTLGYLMLEFSLKNITKFFENSQQRHYYIILNNETPLYKTDSYTHEMHVSEFLQTKPNIKIILEQDRDVFLQLLKRYEYSFAITLLLGALSISLIAFYFIDKLIRPVIELSSLVKEITQTQNYSQTIIIKGKDEISTLAKAFDKMLHGIDKALRQNKELNTEIEETQREVVFTMGAIGESRSKETGNHVKRVADYSKLLALFYGLSEHEAEMLKQASPMHDIGKVAIADAILNKPGRFIPEEFEIMKKHVELGYEMLKHSERSLLKTAAIVAHEHHEKWDGSGYPRGLKEEEIHIYGRITALADVFDALGSERVYKKAWDDERIFSLFHEEKGKHFEPRLVELFFEHLDDFIAIRDKFKD